jgi:hypothetical protein
MNFNFDRIPILGITTLVICALPILFLCSQNQVELTHSAPIKLVTKNEIPMTDFTIPLSQSASVLSNKPESDQIVFSIDPPRPNFQTEGLKLQLRLPQSKQSRQIELPAIVQLEFDQRGSLQFSDRKGQFWLDCKESSGGLVEASLFLNTVSEETICRHTWTSRPDGTPLSNLDEITRESPFRVLAESKWWGPDLFTKEFGFRPKLQRFEVGPEGSANLLEFDLDQWIVFNEGKWIAANDPDTHLPLARITAQNSQSTEIEGWDSSRHIRFKIQSMPSAPLKTKGEELFSQLRIRSEKQVSCVIDKQCLILRAGDWVLKTSNRWKILRKQDEREAFLAGNIAGELFVLDRIDAKGATKSIAGQLFSSKRSQCVPIEFTQLAKSNPNQVKAQGKLR